MASPWQPFSKARVQRLPQCFGVYWLADSNKRLLYIGEGRFPNVLITKEINTRSGNDNTIQVRPRLFRWQRVPGKRAGFALQNARLRAYRRINGRLPPYNEKIG